MCPDFNDHGWHSCLWAICTNTQGQEAVADKSPNTTVQSQMPKVALEKSSVKVAKETACKLWPSYECCQWSQISHLANVEICMSEGGERRSKTAKPCVWIRSYVWLGSLNLVLFCIMVLNYLSLCVLQRIGLTLHIKGNVVLVTFVMVFVLSKGIIKWCAQTSETFGISKLGKLWHCNLYFLFGCFL